MVISLAWQFLKLLAGYFLWQSTPGTPAEHLCCCWSRIMPREPGASMNKDLYPNQMSSLKQDTYAAIVVLLEGRHLIWVQVLIHGSPRFPRHYPAPATAQVLCRCPWG